MVRETDFGERNISMTKAGGDDWFVNNLLFWIVFYISYLTKTKSMKIHLTHQGNILNDGIKFVHPNLYN